MYSDRNVFKQIKDVQVTWEKLRISKNIKSVAWICIQQLWVSILQKHLYQLWPPRAWNWVRLSELFGLKWSFTITNITQNTHMLLILILWILTLPLKTYREANLWDSCYLPLALREDNRHPIMLLATLGSVTLAWMSTLMRDGKLDRKESGRPSSSSSWKLRIIFYRNET